MRLLFIANLDKRQRYRFVSEPLQHAGADVVCFQESPGVLATFVRGVGALRKKPRPDAVVLTGGDLRNVVWFLLVRFMTRARVVLRFGGDPVRVPGSTQQGLLSSGKMLYYLRSRLGVAGSRFMLRHADGVIVVSGYLEEQIRPMLGKKVRVAVSPPVLKIGAQPDRRLPAAQPPLRILTVANCNYREKADGVLVIAGALIECCRKSCRDSSVEYNVVGGGRQFDYLKQAILRLNPPENLVLRLHGYQKDVSGFYGQADLFVYYSTLDAYSLVLAEAQAYGVPVVVNRWGPFPEFLTEGKDTCFYETDRPDTLVETLCRLLKDDKLRRQMGKQARSGFERHHSMSERGAELERYFRGLV